MTSEKCLCILRYAWPLWLQFTRQSTEALKKFLRESGLWTLWSVVKPHCTLAPTCRPYLRIQVVVRVDSW